MHFVFSFKLYYIRVKSICIPGDGFMGLCERGDAYSEAKSITELYALAYSSVASQVPNKSFSFC